MISYDMIYIQGEGCCDLSVEFCVREDCDDQFCPDPLATQLLAMQPIGQ
jgi:hypothetical protein